MSFYLMHRGWMDRPIFREPFSRAQAWVWLIENAAFKETRVVAGSKWVELQRGQLCFSLRFMAKAWKWDEARVRRFIAAAVSENMIRSVADAGQTVITICNYDTYQAPESVADAPPDAAPTQHRRSADAKKNEGNKEEEDSESLRDSSNVAVADPKAWVFGELLVWLKSHTGRPEHTLRAFLAKCCQKFGDDSVVAAGMMVRAPPVPVEPLSAIMERLSRGATKHVRAKSSAISNLYAGAALALADRDAARAKRSHDRGTDLDLAEPLLDGGRAAGAPQITDG